MFGCVAHLQSGRNPLKVSFSFSLVDGNTLDQIWQLQAAELAKLGPCPARCQQLRSFADEQVDDGLVHPVALQITPKAATGGKLSFHSKSQTMRLLRVRQSIGAITPDTAG